MSETLLKNVSDAITEAIMNGNCEPSFADMCARAAIDSININQWQQVDNLPEKYKDGKDFIVELTGWFFWNAAIDNGIADGPDPRQTYTKSKVSTAYFVNDEDKNKGFIMIADGYCYSKDNLICIDGDMQEEDATEWPEGEYNGGPLRIARICEMPTPPEASQ